MTTLIIDELVSKLTELFHEREISLIDLSDLSDQQKQSEEGNQKESALREKVKSLDNEIEQTLNGWLKEQIEKVAETTPLALLQPFFFNPQVETNLSVIKNAFPVAEIINSGRMKVPLGQVFVFGHESIDEYGFSEIYLGGETILTRRKDKKSLVAVLAEAPGEINCVANQWLAGISASKENVGRVSIKIPVFLYDPIQVLKRSGGAWMFVDGRENINHDLSGQIEHRLQEILADRIQFWSGEPREILDRVCTMLNRDLGEWGLQVKAGSVSIIRQLPKMLYEIVSQFSKAEQTILDSLAIGQRSQIVDQSSLTDDDLTFIEAASERENSGRGEGLFLVLRDKMPALEPKSEALLKIFNWLRVHGGATAANYATEITKLYNRTAQGEFDSNKEPGVSDIQLSEQVLLSAFRNPLIGLGEMLERMN